MARSRFPFALILEGGDFKLREAHYNMEHMTDDPLM
jgi:hypothetical protein